MEFLKKTWKFFLGVAVAVISGMLLFRKDDSAELIEESTENGTRAIDNIIESNEETREKIEKLEDHHREEIEKIARIYESKKELLNDRVRKKIENNLVSGDSKKATSYLSQALQVKNLDDL